MHYFDTATFAIPEPGRFGTAAQGLMLGLPLSSMNFSFSKFFSFEEQMRLQFRGEFVNLLSHANFANPQPTGFTSSSGVVSPTLSQIVNTSTISRQIPLQGFAIPV